MRKEGGKRTFFLLTLGCPKNEVDSDLIGSLLIASGWTKVENPEDADLLLVNTCSFIVPAVEESIETVLDLGEVKAEEGKRLAVMGCLVARYGEDTLRTLLPEVDFFVGPSQYAAFAAELHGGKTEDIASTERGRRFSSTLQRGYVYIKISEGCDRRCTYCTIPGIRGPQRSRLWEQIREEARFFLAQGAKELVLVAQDVTSYGQDLYGKACLSLLLEKLLEMEGDYRLRLMYMHPEGVDDQVLTSMKHPHIHPYFDLPMQHVDANVLRSMGRKGGPASHRRLVERIRDGLPGAALRATFMVGFPGEDERAFASLLDFVADTRFDWLGLFGYSQEEGTAAYHLGRTCPPRLVERRLEEIRVLQEEIMRRKAGLMVGRKLRVLVEGESEEAPGYWQARSYREAPDIDGVIFLPAAEELQAGTWREVLVESTEGIDLIAAPLAQKIYG